MKVSIDGSCVRVGTACVISFGRREEGGESDGYCPLLQINKLSTEKRDLLPASWRSQNGVIAAVGSKEHCRITISGDLCVFVSVVS